VVVWSDLVWAGALELGGRVRRLLMDGELPYRSDGQVHRGREIPRWGEGAWQ
jgi:hypothetical protein